MHVIGLSGSLRRGSFNTALLSAAVAEMPTDARLTVRTIHGIPLYDADIEATEGIPTAVADLKEAIVRADGLILATPEYNNSIPGVLKNAVDWLSRPSADIPRVFDGKPVAVIGASPGPFGTVLSQDAWLSVLRTLRARPWFGGRLLVPSARQVFDSEGHIVDAATTEQLRRFVHGFVEFIRLAPR